MSANDNPRDLLHRSHKHGLVLLELSDNCSTLECFICLSSVKGGLAYRCPDCDDFFLHKYCAELPSVIKQHPFHPQHQLELILRNNYEDRGFCSGCSGNMRLERWHYRCDECKMVVHLQCIAATLPIHQHEHKEEEETIQHIAHEHPLESFYVNSPCSPVCFGCGNNISGRTYGCRVCLFVLHESCALSPQEINNHPLHPKHPLTLVVDLKPRIWYDLKWFVYHCTECDFNLNMESAVYVKRHHISIPQNDHNREKYIQDIQHFSHPHPMTYCYTKVDAGLACDFCKENITGDFYVCGDCSFKLHKSCAELPQDMVHPLHTHHHLILQKCYGSCALCCFSRDCFLFECQECNFGLHPRCALLSLSASKEEFFIGIQHIHEHPMRLQTYFTHGDIVCKICNGKCRDLAYNCEQDCLNHMAIHKGCAQLPRESEFSVHPQHPLFLLSQPPHRSIPCAACHESCSGFTLHCGFCKVQFHAGCALMKPTLKHQRHEHALTYFERIDKGKKYDVMCNVCGEDCRIDLYRCIPCSYNLHYSCSALPHSVKHEWHIHPLEFRDKYINEDFDYDEQYCDMCETVRHPEHGVYYCVECRCATHIDCVIPKLNLEKRRRRDELKLRRLDEQILGKEAEKEESKKEFEASRIKFERLTKDLEELKDRRREVESYMKQLE